MTKTHKINGMETRGERLEQGLSLRVVSSALVAMMFSNGTVGVGAAWKLHCYPINM